MQSELQEPAALPEMELSALLKQKPAGQQLGLAVQGQGLAAQGLGLGQGLGLELAAPPMFR